MYALKIAIITATKVESVERNYALSNSSPHMTTCIIAMDWDFRLRPFQALSAISLNQSCSRLSLQSLSINLWCAIDLMLVTVSSTIHMVS